MNTLAKTANPANIAREAIRQLVASRVAPTPENFTLAYRVALGIDAGDSRLDAGTDPKQVLSRLVEGMTRRHPDLDSVAQLQEHVNQGAWDNALDVADVAVGDALVQSSRQWPQLLQQVLGTLEMTHANWTRARKLDAVQHVLLTPSSIDQTCEKLQRLMAGWLVKSEQSAGQTESCAPVVNLPAADQSAEAKAWRLLALTAMDVIRPADRRQRAAKAENSPDSLKARLARVEGVPSEDWLHEIQSACADSQSEIHRQAGLRDRLVKLLRLLCENLALFADDDSWVSGQVTRITEMLDEPFDELALTEAEDTVRVAVQRQSELKVELTDAKTAVKQMLSSLIDRLGTAATTTSEYHNRINDRAEAINQADDLPSLSRVVASMLDDAVEMREGMQRAHGELNAARENTQRYEERVQALEQELVDVSSLVRIDPLTQVLNRRGLEEAFVVEQARTEREKVPMSVALLDIDNFKRLNDTFGHQTGDRALKHVSSMIRGALRPSDTVARYGGEEFVILLPGTTAEEAVNVLTRTQRQLTRSLFLHDDEKILITFSVGVTEFRDGDTHESAVQRADTAVYVAKAAGKNRVQLG